SHSAAPSCRPRIGHLSTNTAPDSTNTAPDTVPSSYAVLSRHHDQRLSRFHVTDRHCVSRKKSDHVDAMTLANILRTDAHAHRRLPADSELAQAITVLARAAQDAIWRRTKAIQELRALLREFYPGFLAAFADGTVTNLA